MSPPPLITAEALREVMASPARPLLLDCGFDLADTEAGARAYAAGHLPGALYAHLDRDLSGPKDGHNGRHPLPAREAFAETLGRWGVRPDRFVVAYDAQGLPYAARAWWMLRWMGHEAVAVLDGGVAAWLAGGGNLTTEVPTPRPSAPYPALPPAMPTVDAEWLAAHPGQRCVLDARSAERWRGETEPYDPVAGRVPGARHRFHKDNLGPDGRFRPLLTLREEFLALGVGPEQVVHMCGSGVTACHNLLAMAAAGLEGSALFPGSWSEWCSDPGRPVARG